MILDDLCIRYPQLSSCMEDIRRAVELTEETFLRGGKLLVCGNGGSAADSLHIVGELMKSFRLPRRAEADEKNALLACGPDGEYLAAHLEGALPAISLVCENALETAYANDAAADLSFAQQVYGLGRPGDILLGISTSGNSRNVVYAAEAARARGMKVLALTGASGGRLKTLCDVTVTVPETETFKVQELHLPVYHAYCAELEERFFGGDR